MNLGSLGLSAGVALSAAVPLAGQTELSTLTGSAAGDHCGAAIAVVGDVDADGVDDWGVGAPESDTGGADAGELRIYSGRNQQLLRTWTGPSAHAHFGCSFAGARDLDGDGHDDVIVGAPQSPSLGYADFGTGFVQARSGQTGAVLWTYAPASGDRVGWRVDGGGEIDGDGVPDVLVGDPFEASCAGGVAALSGASGAAIYSVSGSLTAFGHSVAFLGDLNGDGRAEFAVGEPNLCQGTLSDGRVHVLDGLSGSTLWTQTGAPGFCGDEYGWSVARIADVSGDGLPDVWAGGRDSNCFAGSSAGFADARNGLTGALVFRKQPAAPSFSGYGMGLTGVQDLDGNGSPEVVVGGPGAEPSAFGDPDQPVLVCSGTNGQTIVSLPPATATDAWGFALASFDVNDDGIRDLLVRAPLADSNGVDAGSVRVFTIVRSPVSYCESETSSLGCTPSIGGVGSASATIASPFDVRATSVINNKSGLLFYGFKPRQTPFQGGHMCVVAPTIRTPLSSSGGSAPPANDCSGVLTLDFNARIQSGVDPLLVAGEEVFAQYWSRDPADASTTNLSNALAFYINP
jgi:hypothetical protein